MQEVVVLVLTYLRMIWRFRWAALVGATLSCIAGWIVVMKMPDVYEVRSKVFLDTRSMLRPLLKGLAANSTARLFTRFVKTNLFPYQVIIF